METKKIPLIKYLVKPTISNSYFLHDEMPDPNLDYIEVIEVEIKKAWKLNKTYKEMENTK